MNFSLHVFAIVSSAILLVAFAIFISAWFIHRSETQPKKLSIKRNIIIAIIFCCFFVAAVTASKFNISEKTIVFTVGDEQIDEIEYNFYHTMLINGFCTLYADSLNMLNLDISKNLSEQECSFKEYETWEDFFNETTIETIIAHTALCNDAKQAGYYYNAKDDWNDFYIQVVDQAKKYNLSVSNTIKKMYGKGATENDIKVLFIKYATATNYEVYLEDNMEVTEKEISDEFGQNQSVYTTVSYLQYDIFADIPDGATDTQIETCMETAKTEAKDFYDSVHSEDTFEAAAKKHSGNKNINIRKNNVSYNEVDNAIREKLFSCEEEGQIFFIEDKSNNCYKIVYFIGKTINDSNTATIRQILVTPISSTGSYLPNEDDYKKAFAEAKNIEEEFLKTEQKEDNFAKLAKEKSSDTGSSQNGGLLTFVESGTYEKEMDEWIFDSRKPGDIGIVKTTYGYHILYFVEYTDPIWKVNITNTLKHNKVDKYIDNLIQNYPLSYPEPDAAVITG